MKTGNNVTIGHYILGKNKVFANSNNYCVGKALGKGTFGHVK